MIRNQFSLTCIVTGVVVDVAIRLVGVQVQLPRPTAIRAAQGQAYVGCLLERDQTAHNAICTNWTTIIGGRD